MYICISKYVYMYIYIYIYLAEVAKSDPTLRMQKGSRFPRAEMRSLRTDKSSPDQWTDATCGPESQYLYIYIYIYIAPFTSSIACAFSSFQ